MQKDNLMLEKAQILRLYIAAIPFCHPHHQPYCNRSETFQTQTHRKHTLRDIGTLETLQLCNLPKPQMTAKTNTTAAASTKQEDALLDCSSKLEPLAGFGQITMGQNRVQKIRIPGQD